MTTTKGQTMTKTLSPAERRGLAAQEQRLYEAGLERDSARATALADTETAIAIADEVLGQFERGEIEFSEVDGLVDAMVAERIR